MLGAICDAEFHARQHDQHHHRNANNQRGAENAGIWRRLQKCVSHQRDAKRRHQCRSDHVFSDRRNQGIQFRVDHQVVGAGRANRHHPHHHHYLHHQLAVGLLAIIACGGMVRAEEGTTAIANPVATSTGSVANQAVQINQGGYSQQGFGGGHVCNSSTLVFTPFFLGSNSYPGDGAASRNQNFGVQLSFSVPLDTEMVRLCKDLAKRKIEKERLDYELVRVLKCIEIKKTGYVIHPSSPYVSVCGDVIAASSVQK